MVTADGTVKILDFGLASLAPEVIADADAAEARGDLTAAGAIMGTPDFISPEQAEDARKADIRSDIYSLGATLYYLLSGRVPFAEGSVMQKLKRHAESDPEPLSTVRLDVPADLERVIMKMMAKDPDERFQTPEKLAEALKPFSQPTEPQSVGPQSVELRKLVEPQTHAAPHRWMSRCLSRTAVAVWFVAAMFAALIYFLQTDYGLVRVEVSDPSLRVIINDQTITMNDEDGKSLKIRPGNQTLIVRKDDADFEFETDRFQIRRGDEVAFKVEMLVGEIVVQKDDERFYSKTLSDNIEMRQILDRMVKAYAECKSYFDSGVIKFVSFQHAGSREATVDYSFTTAFVHPDRFRFEIKDEDHRLLISANGQDIQTWWDVEPGIQKPESMELAMAQAMGFSGGDASRIPALLMPHQFEFSGGLELLNPKRIEDSQLQNVECFRLEYNFRDEQFTLWIDKQSYLIRRIDERINLDSIRIERTTTCDPTIDGEITDEMLEFDPPDEDLDQLQGD
jgi:outer membrane lipoprotein-sorting protein